MQYAAKKGESKRMAQCYNCGAELRATAKVCAECGQDQSVSVGDSIRHHMKRISGLRYLYRVLKFNYLLQKTRNFRFVYPTMPGHYYSPLPDYKEILSKSQVLFDTKETECRGIDLKGDAQLELIDVFSNYYEDFPFPSRPGENSRYYYATGWFSGADAVTLYSILRHYRPSRIVEIGSGFSSAAMLDVNDMFLDKKIDFTFIEPNPERLFGLFKYEDRSKYVVLQQRVQDVPLQIFQALSVNDVLFVDSSHVVKIGSDVAHILFNILPELRPGVIVHFHDIFWPFEYPKEWLLDPEGGRAWNEVYFMRSFLQFNDAFEIMYFNSFIAEHYADVLRDKMPLGLDRPSSLWLKKGYIT
jgi:predicted O-methyltransferase YrrM